MAGGGGGTERLIELVRHEGRDKDPLVRQQLATIYIAARVANYTNLPRWQRSRKVRCLALRCR